MRVHIPIGRRTLYCALVGVFILASIVCCALFRQSDGKSNQASPIADVDHATMDGMQLGYEFTSHGLFGAMFDAPKGAPKLPRVACFERTIHTDEFAALEHLESVAVVVFTYSEICAPIVEILSRCRQVRELRLYACTAGGGKLDIVRRLPWLEVVVIVPPRQDREIDLAPLNILEDLKGLSLQYSNVNLDELRHIRNPKKLVLMNFESSTLEGSLALLRRFTCLEMLDLSRSNIDAGNLASLADLASLKQLRLSSCKFEDADVDTLGRMTQLEKMWLLDTDLTKDGYERLRSLLPDCQVYWRSTDDMLGAAGGTDTVVQSD